MVLDFPMIFSAPILAFVITFFSILWLIRKKASWVLDQPNSRSLHIKPVPRSGGIGLLLGVVLTWSLFSLTVPTAIWLGIALLMTISFVDDLKSTSVWSRLLVQGIVATVFSVNFLSNHLEWPLIVCAAVMIIWMSNLYNFMDGSDGLAGGMTLIGFGSYGWFSYVDGSIQFAIINFIVAAAALAFLLHNFHPARIFLGDSGSVPLGFLAATFGLIGWAEGIWTIWFPLLVFSPFIMDATVTLIKRLLHGKQIWQAHREHYYQHLVQSGWGHRNTALLGYILMIGSSCSAVWAGQQDIIIQQGALMIWIGVYLALMFIFDYSRKYHAAQE